MIGIVKGDGDHRKGDYMLNRYDVNNVKNFEDGVRKAYLCTMCGQYTTLDESYSSRGYNLVCCSCFGKIIHLTGMTSKQLLNAVHKQGQLKEKNYKENKHD